MDLDAQRRAAGERAAQFVQDGMVIGYGTGWRGTLERIAAVLPGATHREGPPTDNGGVVVDAPLPAGANLERIDRALKGIAGVVDHGLFLDLSPTIVVGGPSDVRVISGG